MTATYKFHIDPGHGWLEVPRSDVRDAGVLGQISHCSYYDDKSDKLYLEEDCDASLFAQAVGLDWEIDTIEVHHDTRPGQQAPCKRFPNWRPLKIGVGPTF